MKKLRPVFILAFVIGIVGTQIHLNEKKESKIQFSPTTLVAANPKTLHDLVSETCGACHSNVHVRPPGEYALNSAAEAVTPGKFAQNAGIANPLTPTSSDPRTALIIQKPMEGSVTPHGGIKIPESHPAIQALMEVVSGARAVSELDPPVPSDIRYLSSMNPDEHEIIYARRTFRYTGFKSLRSTQNGGGLYRLKYRYDAGTRQNVIFEGPTHITNYSEILDAQHPSLSLDGSKVVFSCRHADYPNSWTICEVNSDGTGGVRRITTPRPRAHLGGMSHDVNPYYLPYLPNGDPARAGEGGIGFLSDQAGFRDEYNTTRTLSLYVADANGGNIRQLDFNPSHNLSPWLDSYGTVVYTRWEHNEHQGQNFMSLFHMASSDYDSAGTNQFGVFGEHVRTMGNSFHGPSEILDVNTFGKTGTHDLTIGNSNGIVDPIPYAKFVGRKSSRDAEGGSLAGYIFPRLQGERNGTRPTLNIMAVGDDVEMGDPLDMANISSVTYRSIRSMIHTGLNDTFVVSLATLTGVQFDFDSFLNSTDTIPIFGNWMMNTSTITTVGGEPKLHTFTPLLADPNYHFEDAIPVVVKPTPPKLGKPIDPNQNTGEFTSGNVMNRQRDGQPSGFSRDDVSMVRFIRALQFSQRSVDTGRDTDEGIASAIVGLAPIAPDGSFSAAVPANVPLQFQLLDKNGHVLVNHKPWLNVQPGAVERCVGCHAPHNKEATAQTLLARSLPSSILSDGGVEQFHFHQDIQPILDNKCISCHNNALVQGAAGRNRALSLVGRWTPPGPQNGGTTESYQALVGGMGMMGMGGYVRSQKPRESELIWWLTGKEFRGSNMTEKTFPDPEDAVNHKDMLTAEELEKITNWIGTGINFRVVNNDRDIFKFRNQSDLISDFHSNVWPVLQTSCLPCHDGSINDDSIAPGRFAMDLDGSTGAESQAEVDEARYNAFAARVNYMIPEASLILRKPLGLSQGGLSHVGGDIFTGIDDPNYRILYNWVQGANLSLAPGDPVTDLVSVNNFPNPFRDHTSFVYGLTGAAASKVEINIYSQSGKLIRELDGPTTSGTTIGWNKIDWDGKDKNGKSVANDVYFYVVKAEFGDGTKKKFRGKCVKVE